ncbi:hypothetical protein A3G55_03695 [Candidatus Giovannonibacteria bacterium RIFCSPLOWO2_12_FULL_44_25]|uniref:Uncharacterized protein n=3 Tax=Parcubacteria group TaxID=1794811 RepID=A0A837IKI9_9BACT|nr:MAG: hypothetical protein UW15_C0031G0007 [Parcubacteria group bacterium GW2011_GWC1_44_10]KKT59132.1 MAG: hypothetical protein UW53_C0021G0007 [Candidatus Giovannonibacteria bacterium GW2011_GWA1_44_25]KKU11966.1 MAG: hypothetical protein UX18_C0037G0006 [Candidatus Azambacteria bacterium GW2011_GWC2_45_7b]KKU28990.1 MAG: hypothetical protein UX43_C0017G0007 [Candidatus Giovannonibacteria bacterium GW2011_GWB1_46_20]OGF49669.1 MAG: hypothetical protein A2120_01865 [Candidatus Giovannonibact
MEQITKRDGACLVGLAMAIVGICFLGTTTPNIFRGVISFALVLIGGTIYLLYQENRLITPKRISIYACGVAFFYVSAVIALILLGVLLASPALPFGLKIFIAGSIA